MILAAYLVTGFLVASVYAVGMLRGRRDRHHRLGLLIPFDRRRDRRADPVRGRRHRRPSDRRRPAGQVRRDGVRAAHAHGTSPSTSAAAAPPTASRAGSGSRASTRSWSASAPTPRSPGSTRCRPTTGRRRTRCCTGRSTRWWGSAPRSSRSGRGSAFAWWRRRDIPRTQWFLRAVAVSGVAAIVALECGWIVTEVGRQPWIVYKVMRTKDAVTGASGVWFTFSVVLVLYAALGVATVLVLRTMARRWRDAPRSARPRCPTGRARHQPAAAGRAG